MTRIDSTTAGQFCWIELATTDLAKAKPFYEPLLGWTAEEAPAGELGTYTLFTKAGLEIAGAYVLPEDMRAAGVSPHWMPYVSVDSADDAVKRAKALGATVNVEPLDVLDIGRMAVLQDPTGAGFSVWQAKGRKGETLRNEPGAPCWFELATRDAAAARSFYGELFGWSMTPNKIQTPGGEVEYTLIGREGTDHGGMLPMGPEFGDAPPHWMVYLQVEDLDRTHTSVTALGGRVVVPPMPVPDVGRFLVAIDPSGAAITFMQLAAR